MTTAWTRLMPRDALLPGTVTAVQVAGTEIAIACTPEGIFAVDDVCPHAETRLTEGRLRGCRPSGPLHGASFDVRVLDGAR